MTKARELTELRTRRQLEFEASYELERQRLFGRMKTSEGASVRERFLSQIRRWYIDYRDANGKFPDLPPEDEGGSKVIHSMPARGIESANSANVKKVPL